MSIATTWFGRSTATERRKEATIVGRQPIVGRQFVELEGVVVHRTLGRIGRGRAAGERPRRFAAGDVPNRFRRGRTDPGS
ncbi:MAG TPA: hypothetical protein VES39_09245 [Rhodospirillales bacterium]|nr:hypothetical protein [Rhodospirillales bacterium]